MKYDVIVVGGGPAGLMAAAHAGELGARTLLLEKNNRLGAKLLLTGGGRCNLTNKIDDPNLMAARFGDRGKFLISAFNKFGVRETIDFFQSRGLKIKVEKNHQVFPASDRAGEVFKILLNYAKQAGVEIRAKAEVKDIVAANSRIRKIILADGREAGAKNYILATGGQSYPQTGSTGQGYKWLKQLGHKIMPLRQALAPIIVEEEFIKNLEGLSLSQAAISLRQGDKKIVGLTGEMVFTAAGLSGPVALDLSRYIKPESITGLILELDFFPEFDPTELDKRFQSAVALNGKKLFKNCLAGIVQPKLLPVLLKILSIAEDKKAADITRLDRTALVKLLKCFKLKIRSLAGFDKAMITAGGVSLKEINPKTMQSKIISNLYVVGELLDLDGPTGGYNLQASWSTGYAAGESSAI